MCSHQVMNLVKDLGVGKQGHLKATEILKFCIVIEEIPNTCSSCTVLHTVQWSVLLFDAKITHQSLAVQESCPTVASCGPFGEADDVVQVPA